MEEWVGFDFDTGFCTLQGQMFNWLLTSIIKYVRVNVSENKAESMPSYIFMLDKEWIILGNSSCDIQITLSFVTKPICASLLLICKLWKVWRCLTDHLFYERRIIIAFRYSAILQGEFGEKKKKCIAICWPCYDLWFWISKDY